MNVCFLSDKKGMKLYPKHPKIQISNFYIDVLEYLLYFCKTSCETPLVRQKTKRDRIFCQPKSIREGNFTGGDLFLIFRKRVNTKFKMLK